MIGDLHCHTKLSDGSNGIDDLVLYAKRINLDFLGITDHDTMAGISRATVLGNRIGVNIIGGVEISCIDPDTKRQVHILCYLPNKPNRLEAFIAKTLDSRKKAGKLMIEKVMKDYPVTFEHISHYTSPSKSIYKIHIIRALMDLGYDTKVYGDLYKNIFVDNKDKYFVPVEYPSVYDTLDYIKIAKGVAVLAHPSNFKSMDLFQKLAENKLIDGVEIHHPKNTENDMKVIGEIAEKYNLITTGGTDFHGFNVAKKAYPLGSFVTNQENITRLFETSMSKCKK